MGLRLLILATLALGCARSGREAPPVVPDPYAPVPPVSVPAPTAKINLDSLLDSLSLDEKVGQVLMPWLSGAYAALDAEGFLRAAAWVDSFAVGGIVVSVGSPLDVAAKLNALQERSRLPLLIAADLEWGAGMRLQGATAFPMVMAIGATGRELDAYELGRVTALEARAVGIHLTFSPVSDVNNNPANPIINTRSFGEDPRAVATLVAAYIKGASEHGLYTTAKHFPGHGDTDIDSHLSLPAVAGCWERLDTLELIPFRAAIEAGVTAIMTAHVAYRCDSTETLPATLSGAVTSGILRDSLGFQGVAVTDALTMGAVVERFGPGESAVRAFLAGNDILLMPSDLGTAFRAMVAAVRNGRIPEDRLNRSVRKILQLKLDAGLFERRTVSLDRIPHVVGRSEFQQIADDIAQRALTLIQEGEMRSFRSARGRWAVITYAEETNLTIGNVLVEELRRRGDTVATFRLYPPSGPLSYDSARTLISGYPRVMFATSVRPIAWRGHIALPDSLAALILATAEVKPTLLVSLGSPYLLRQLPGYRGAYLLAWSDVPATERAVAVAVTGGAPIRGRTPVTLSPSIPRGFGIELPLP
ncbi:Beta-hexosaminidase [bacterium HR33]|nr:Beta-hexosaminidase [bacterium HR33]